MTTYSDDTMELTLAWKDNRWAKAAGLQDC